MRKIGGESIAYHRARGAAPRTPVWRGTEGGPRGEQPGMVERLERADRLLVTASHDQLHAGSDFEAPQHEAGGQGYLLLAIVGTVFVVRITHLELGPELFQDMGLQRGIPYRGHAERSFVAGWDGDPECRLDITASGPRAPAFAGRDRRRHDRIVVGKYVAAGRHADAKKAGHDIIAMLLVG